ncbi:MAG TPA: putative metallopeptidase [Bryobacteraceae bacterium]|nr:putative metallopeptidase [Bryobacteraceae bacterium]
MPTEKQKREAVRSRPFPPKALSRPNGGDLFVPAMEIGEWALEHIIAQDGAIHNPIHKHLRFAQVGWLWSSVPHTKSGITIVGMCEQPRCNGNKWLKARVDYQLTQFFGPKNLDFLITLYAPYFARADDGTFCCAAEHEMAHAGQAVDEDNVPKFSKTTGLPQFAMRGHDVEVFVFEWERYGAGKSAGKSAELAKFANTEPTIAQANIARACGTCLRA